MATFVFLSTFAVYLFTMAPSITVGDSGEFCASSVILGLCHSPGYPLFALLGKAATLLLPLASFAYRVNILSALCASATAALLFMSLMAVTGNEIAGIKLKPGGTIQPTLPGREWLCAAATMFFAFSPAFWKGAIQAEVFSLNTLFAIIIIYSAIKNRVDLALFAFGLGLGNHHTLIFVSPIILAGIYANKDFTLKRLAVLAVMLMLGLSIYAYLPVRAAKTPQLNWGNPVNVTNFIRDVTRADYGSLSLTVGEKLPRTLSNSLRQMERFAGAIREQFTVFGLVLGVLGLYYGVKKKYSNFRIIVFVWFLAGPFFLLLANMQFDAQTEGILERFYILVNLFWAFFILAGIEGVAENIKSPLLRMAGFAVITVCILALRINAVSWRQYYLEYDYGRNLFKTLAPGSAFFMDGGDDTFYSTAYLSFAEGRRKDVELHDRGGLVFRNVYGPDFRRIPKEEKENRRREVERMYYQSRPVYFSTFNKTVMPGVELAADGILYRPKSSGHDNSYFAYSLRGVYGSDFTDYRSRALVPLYPYFEAIYDPADALGFWRYALLKWPDAMWLEGNIKVELIGEAYAKYASGDLASAKKVYEEVLKLYPGEYDVLLNLGVISEKQNNFDKAIEYYTTAARLEPGKTDAYYNMAVIYWQKSNWGMAVEMFNKMLEINPGDQRAIHYLPGAKAKLSQSSRK